MGFRPTRPQAAAGIRIDPPVSLPKREFMENAKVIWDELGLPELKKAEPEAPADNGDDNGQEEK